MNDKQSGFLKICGLISCVVIIVMIIVKFWPEPSLDKVGIRLVNAALDGDSSLLMKYSLNEEIKKLDLSEDVIDRMYDQYLTEIFADFKLVDSTVVWQNPDRQVVVTGILRDSKGHETEIGFFVYDTPEGARAYVTTPIIMGAFVAKYGPLYNKASRGDQVWLAAHHGIVSDKEILEALGIAGFLSGGSDAKLSSWTAYKNLYERLMLQKGYELVEGVFVVNES